MDRDVWVGRCQPITECHEAKPAGLKEPQGRFLTPKSEQTARRCHRQATGEAARVVSHPGEAFPGGGETYPVVSGVGGGPSEEAAVGVVGCSQVAVLHDAVAKV
jgi:hypothetical protein